MASRLNTEAPIVGGFIETKKGIKTSAICHRDPGTRQISLLSALSVNSFTTVGLVKSRP